MIPQAAIQAWSTTRPWPTLVAVEQDLVLARLIIEIARHPALGDGSLSDRGSPAESQSPRSSRPTLLAWARLDGLAVLGVTTHNLGPARLDVP